MEENNTQNNEKLSTEEIKKEAVETAKEVKETLKSTNAKQKANVIKEFITNFFKNPINEIESVVKSSKNQFLMIAIIVLAVWLVAILIGELVDIFKSYSYVSALYSNFATFLRNSVNNIASVIKAILAPIISIAALSGIIYVVAKDKKKPFLNIVTSVIIAKVPVVLASVVSLLDLLGAQVYRITSPFSGFCSILSTILVYFAIKALYDEKDDNSFIKKFVIVMGIFYIAKLIIGFFGIYI